MNLKYAFAGLVALGGVALAAGSASAMPNGLAAANGAGQAGNVEQVRLICDEYGRCFRRPNYGYGYGGPRYYGGGPRYGFRGGYDRPHRGYGYGGGYGGGRW